MQYVFLTHYFIQLFNCLNYENYYKAQMLFYSHYWCQKSEFPDIKYTAGSGTQGTEHSSRLMQDKTVLDRYWRYIVHKMIC